MNNKPSRTLILFYVLVVYIILQFIWWSYLLTSLSGEVNHQKADSIRKEINDELQEKAELEALKRKHHSRIAMIVGEGSVFLLLLAFGIYRVKKSFEKETELISQQRNFMLSITHELKTPLAAIKLNLQTLQKRNLSKEQQQEILFRTGRENERLNHLIENVLMAARMENSSGITFQAVKINLSSFLHQHITSLQNNERIVLQSENELEILADVQLALPMLFSNLIENALKYSTGQIRVRAFLQSNKVCVEIIDEGPGIPPEEKEKIFEKFYRIGNEDTRNAKGTGLGLFIVKYIAEKNNITLKLSDNSPTGTIFRLTFNT
jgi:two-component system, OmpR family, phosphate regulon sensor histidine kinase PhoR